MKDVWILLELGRKRLTVADLNNAIHNLHVRMVKRASAIGASK